MINGSRLPLIHENVFTGIFGLIGGSLTASFLAFSSLVILKPIKHIFAFYFAKAAELGGDVLDLIGGGRSCPPPVKLLQNSQLLHRWIPSR